LARNPAEMEKPTNPSSQSDSPTLVPESAASVRRSETAAQTLTPPPSSSDSPTMVPESSSGAATLLPQPSSSAAQTGAGVTSDAWAAAGLQPGTILGGRYEILQALGEGGMGTVYKARDRELDRLVALKVIRPDLARNPAIIQRFKQELILARQVTHRNVVRIFDLGEADGIKFITMEFIEGQDLRSLLLQHKKFSPEEATEVIRQVCLALDAAHSEGVIHRDLKPQNIMRDAQDRIVVMDFGLARSLQSDGMTQTGALIGTMEYMSPEQGLGQELDQRSDLFTLGLIFYELLSGQVPYKADSALASLLKRTQERAAPVSSLENKVPRALSDIVGKCLERDPKLRYSSAKELLTDLEAWQGKSAAKSIRLPAVQPWGQDIPWVLISVAAVVIILAAAGFLLRGKLFGPRANGPAGPVASLAILPFRNASGDASLNWLGGSIGEMLTTDVGQSASLRTVPSDRVHQILRDLRITPDSTLDADTLRRLAEFSNSDQVVWGQYARFGDEIRIDATLQDLKQQRSISLKAEAPSQKELLSAVDQLAHSIQQNLAISSQAVKELRTTAFAPSSKSVDAVRDYSEGTELVRQGQYLEAVKKFQASVNEDPNFAFAYAKLAQTYGRLGYDKKADEVARKAVDLSNSLSAPEKYRIIAIQARIAKDNQKAIEAYQNLAKISPDDPDLQFSLAELYYATGAYEHARELYSKLIDRDPKYVDALLGIGQTEYMSGNYQLALDYLNKALSLAIQLDNDEERAIIQQAIGTTYRLLNKPEDALNSYQQSLQAGRRVGNKRSIAKTLDQMAPVQDTLGQQDAALKSYQEALRLWSEIGDQRGAGSTLINMGFYYDSHGDYDKALSLTKQALQIEHEIGEPADEAQCLNNIGWFYLEKAQYDEAQTYFERALQLRQKLNFPADIADSNYNLADTSVRVGQYDKALGDYLRAVDGWRKAGDNRGVAIANYGMGTLFEYQGRYGAAVTSLEDAVKTFRQLQDRSNWMAEILGGYGNALALDGRSDEAQKNLEEALRLARELKSNPLIARMLNYQGDRLFYSGDFKAARPLFEQALPATQKANDRYLALLTRINLAKLAVKEGRAREAVATLTKLRQEADGLGVKYFSALCTLYLGEALLNNKDLSRAATELEAALRSSQDLGARAIIAQAHFLLAGLLRSKGNSSEAASHLTEARRILDEIQKEARSDRIVKRSDFSPIYTASNH
jgi:tetratricopeptide (TPR) repeat protein